MSNAPHGHINDSGRASARHCQSAPAADDSETTCSKAAGSDPGFPTQTQARFLRLNDPPDPSTPAPGASGTPAPFPPPQPGRDPRSRREARTFQVHQRTAPKAWTKPVEQNPRRITSLMPHSWRTASCATRPLGPSVSTRQGNFTATTPQKQHVSPWSGGPRSRPQVQARATIPRMSVPAGHPQQLAGAPPPRRIRVHKRRRSTPP